MSLDRPLTAVQELAMIRLAEQRDARPNAWGWPSGIRVGTLLALERRGLVELRDVFPAGWTGRTEARITPAGLTLLAGMGD